MTENTLPRPQNPAPLCHLGYHIDKETEELGEPVGLTEADLLSGITMIGDEAPQTLLQILHQTHNKGYNTTVLDYNQTYRNILKAAPDARILRPGTDITLNPLQTQGLTPTEYTELLLLATTQAYQLTPWLQDRLRQLLNNAYQQAEGRTLTIPELEGIIQQQKETHRANRDHRSAATLETIEHTLQHLLQGETSNTFEAQGARPKQLHKKLTIIELGEYESYSFRTFLQALIIMQFVAHIKTANPEHEPTIITVDSAENLFPNRYHTPLHLKQPHFIYKLQETLKQHPNQTIYLTTGHPAELDFYALHLTKTVITHPLQTMQDISQTQRHLPPATPNLWHLKKHQATLKTWTGTTQLIAIQRPTWLYQTKPTDQQLTTRLTTDQTAESYPTKIAEGTKLEQDFGKEAWAAYQMLEALKTYDGITRAGLVQTFSTLPSKKAWQIEAKLETQGYIRPTNDTTTQGGKRTTLRLNLTGLRALKEHRTKHPTLENTHKQTDTQAEKEE